MGHPPTRPGPRPFSGLQLLGPESWAPHWLIGPRSWHHLRRPGVPMIPNKASLILAEKLLARDWDSPLPWDSDLGWVRVCQCDSHRTLDWDQERAPAGETRRRCGAPQTLPLTEWRRLLLVYQTLVVSRGLLTTGECEYRQEFHGPRSELMAAGMGPAFIGGPALGSSKAVKQRRESIGFNARHAHWYVVFFALLW